MQIQYGIMTEELFFHEISIDKPEGRRDSDSRMTSFDVIIPLKLQSIVKILLKETLHCLEW